MRLSRKVGLGLVALAIAGIAPLWIVSPTASGKPAAHLSGGPTGCPSFCELSGRAWAEPSLLFAGETTTVTLTTRALCRAEVEPDRVVFVVDPDARVDRGTLREIQSTLRGLADALDLPNDPSLSMGLVQVGDRAEVLAPLDDDGLRLRSAASRLDLDPDQALAEGIEAARRMIASDDTFDCRQLRSNRKAIVVFASDIPSGECQAAERAARKARSEHLRLYTVCAGERCGAARCLRDRVASSPRYHYELRKAELGLVLALKMLGHEVISITVRQLSVIETLREGMEYVPGSAQPPALLSADGRRLTWESNSLPTYAIKEGITLSYGLQPLRSGFSQVSEGTQLRWTDNQSRQGEARLAPAWVQVFGPVIAGP